MSRARTGDVVVTPNGSPGRVKAIVGDKAVVKFANATVETHPIYNLKVVQ